MNKKARTNVIASKAKQSSKKLTDFIKSHPRPLILTGLALVLTLLFFLNYSLTHAYDSITLTINGGPTNNGKEITINKGNCTTFTLDTTTTTDNTTGYNIKAYTKTSSTGITIEKQDGTKLPTNPNNPTEIITTTKAEIKDKQTTTYQACAEENISDGNKTAEVAYILTENIQIYAKVINGANFQDKTTNINETCEAIPIYNKSNPDPNSTITMMDNRDGQEYDVRRLQDGKCWMVDDLKFELTNGMILTPDATNVTTNTQVWFTVDGTETGAKLSGMTNNFTTVQGTEMTRNGATGTASPNLDAWRQADPSDTDNCKNNKGNSSNGGIAYNPSSKVGCGYLYNFYTATAGSSPQASFGTPPHVAGYLAPDSICPANWKLPSGYVSSGDINNDFTFLNAKMDSSSVTSGSTNVKYYVNWSPIGSFRGTLSGHWGTNSGVSVGYFGNQGAAGYTWSSSIGSATGARAARYGGPFSDGAVGYPATADSIRYYGFAIRCLVN
ncbi:MAG: fibrobacter succinogenes major paralogous domain-containing protein [Candidatus Nomurabacteria bacterium]|jgi:hypothetical protein|nr:fibrobacter succinogenes major paralogous domain-containing protein [Candidatus Nomurabacteria bacterium]